MDSTTVHVPPQRARVTTSSLQNLDDGGSAALVGAEPRRLAWHVSGRETCHPLQPLSPRVCIYPDTTPHDSPTRSIYDRALHATSFMQRYHPGIYVPARLLALSVMEDEQTRLAQSQAGDDLVGQTIAMVSCAWTCMETPRTASTGAVSTRRIATAWYQRGSCTSPEASLVA